MSMIWTAVALTPNELAEVSAARNPFDALEEKLQERCTGLDKAWDAAHWLITGGTEEVQGSDGFIKSGGREVDTIEADYGLARYFSPKETGRIRDLLLALPREKLEARWDSELIAEDEVYPFGHAGVREGDLEFVLGHIDEFRDFLSRLDVETLGLLVFL